MSRQRQNAFAPAALHPLRWWRRQPGWLPELVALSNHALPGGAAKLLATMTVLVALARSAHP